MGKICPKHVELILEINKTVIVASRWFSILLYLQTLDVYRPATGIGRVAENTNKLPKCFINTADF
jgi:hypothetical protein